MAEPVYQHGQFGLLVVDPSSGRVVHSLNPARLFIPGSTTKLFTVSAAWDAFGGQHRTTTPVVVDGQVSGNTLSGNLVLVAAGDLTMGGRIKADGTIDFVPVDHTYADAFPTLAGLTPEDPLAGVNSLAQQVRAHGITHVKGDVVVDDRLFAPDPELTTGPVPMIINDNVIDVLSTPAKAGQAATLTWRPQTSANSVSYHVKTVAAGQPSNVTASMDANGVITVSGTLAADSKPWLAAVPVSDPAAFARTALIDALRRAGVTVDAPPTGPDPAPPAKVSTGDPVATLVSPPFQETGKLILKVSHNLGADLMVCLLAVNTGSKDCQDGFPVIGAYDRKVGVDPAQASQADGEGGVAGDKFTPQAYVPLLKWWTARPDFTFFRQALPILGDSGDLALFGTTSPAKGKVFAKTGTRAEPNRLTNSVLVTARGLAGYLDAGNGRYEMFYVVFNDAGAASVDQVLGVAQDITQIAALLQEEAAKGASTS